MLEHNCRTLRNYYFGCDVHGFIPSPISQSKKWLEKYDLAKNPKYTFHSYGVGAVDGYVELFDYDWEQISIHRAHDRVDPNNSLNLLPAPRLKVHRVKVATLASILAAVDIVGDVDVLKIDVEGSEWGFFQAVFDAKNPAKRCPPARMLLLEFHHHVLEEQYGSSPELNEMTIFLQDCGFYIYESHDFRMRDPHDEKGANWKRIAKQQWIRGCADKDLQWLPGDDSGYSQKNYRTKKTLLLRLSLPWTQHVQCVELTVRSRRTHCQPRRNSSTKRASAPPWRCRCSTTPTSARSFVSTCGRTSWGRRI